MADFDPKKMDEAVEVAEKDLDNLPQTITIPMARWFASHYLKAGHKRLGRVLVQLAKNTRSMKDKDFTTPEDLIPAEMEPEDVKKKSKATVAK